MVAAVGVLSRSRLFWCYWFPVIVYCVVIFVQSAYPSPDSLQMFPHSDKVMHFFAYAAMGWLFCRAFKKSSPHWKAPRIILFSVLLATLYGVGDEIHQSFVTDRMADGMDVIADFAGGTFGALCCSLVRFFHGRL
jgi:VanZ family protein